MRKIITLIFLIVSVSFGQTIPIKKNINHHIPRNLKWTWHGTCDWDNARADLVVATFADSLAFIRSKAINDSVYYVPTKDNYGGGVFGRSTPQIPWWQWATEWYTYNFSGGIVYYGNPMANWSNYCGTHGAIGRWNQAHPDTLVDILGTTGYKFDGTHSDNSNLMPWANVDWNRNGTYDDPEGVMFPISNAGWNTTAMNVRYNMGGGSSMGGGDATLNQGLILGWTFTGQNKDTSVRFWQNGWGIENPGGSFTAGVGNRWSSDNHFDELLRITRMWDRYARYKPSFFYMTILMQDAFDDMNRDSTNKARWVIGMGALTKMYTCLHDDDQGNNDHSSWCWYDEMELDLGYMNPDTVYRLSLTPGDPLYYAWVAFYDSGCVILRSGEDYATRPTVTISSFNIIGLPGYDGEYFHFRGNQDTIRNNGQSFSSVILRAKGAPGSATAYRGDAVFLVKHRDTVITDVIIDNAYYPTTPGNQAATYTGAFARDAGADTYDKTNYLQPVDPNLSAIYLNRTYSDCMYMSSMVAAMYRQHYAPTYPTATSYATYTPKLNVMGWYKLYEWHGWYGALDASYTETDSAHLTVYYSGGSESVVINQYDVSKRGQWNYIGTYYYTPTSNKHVVLSNQGTNGKYVVADAFRWEFITSGVAPPEPEPDHLIFGNQPSNTVAGAIIPTVTVRVVDAADNLMDGDNRSITIAIGNNPGSGTLSGTTVINAYGGIASFNNLSINNIGMD